MGRGRFGHLSTNFLVDGYPLAAFALQIGRLGPELPVGLRGLFLVPTGVNLKSPQGRRPEERTSTMTDIGKIRRASTIPWIPMAFCRSMRSHVSGWRKSASGFRKLRGFRTCECDFPRHAAHRDGWIVSGMPIPAVGAVTDSECRVERFVDAAAFVAVWMDVRENVGERFRQRCPLRVRIHDWLWASRVCGWFSGNPERIRRFSVRCGRACSGQFGPLSQSLQLERNWTTRASDESNSRFVFASEPNCFPLNRNGHENADNTAHCRHYY